MPERSAVRSPASTYNGFVRWSGGVVEGETEMTYVYDRTFPLCCSYRFFKVAALETKACWKFHSSVVSREAALVTLLCT